MFHFWNLIYWYKNARALATTANTAVKTETADNNKCGKFLHWWKVFFQFPSGKPHRRCWKIIGENDLDRVILLINK